MINVTVEQIALIVLCLFYIHLFMKVAMLETKRNIDAKFLCKVADAVVALDKIRKTKE